MFAGKVAKPQPKVAALTTGALARVHPGVASRSLHSPSQTPHNTAEASAAAWDFGKVPMFPAGAARPQHLAVPGFVQAKLAIGAVDDPLEREADRVAGEVMQKPISEASVTAVGSQISRACPFTPHRADSDAVPGTVREVLRSPGRPLDSGTRSFFEPRFGRDFSQIRIHSDERAAASAHALGALAYTVGSEIAFAAGRYQPATSAGRGLLAHELVHTQQQQSGFAIQRAGDFDIRGINPNAAARPSVIFFDSGSVAVAASEQPKITALATPPGTSLTLNGYSSEEGTPAGNLQVINARIASVHTALQSAGHTGPIVSNPQPTAGIGQLDYRAVRAVEIVATGVAPSTPQCQPTAANPNPQNTSCGTSFSGSQPTAVTKVTDAVAALAAPTPTVTALVNTFFPGVPVANITTRLNSLLAQLGVMATPTGKQCHNTCDGACARPGYNSGQGPTAVMTLCPDFINSFTVDQRVEMLMHEGMHATAGTPVVDLAYRSQRLVGSLSGAQAETNTDSYVNLILRLQPGVAGPIPGGPPVDPVDAGMTPAEGSAARTALAFLEKWVEIAEWDTSQLYEAIKHNIGRPGGWNPADNYHADTQHRIGWLLTLTDPGNVPPYAITPTNTDQIKVAGIHDRYNRMSRAVAFTPISISKGASDAWSPNLGASFVVTAAFFALSAADQVLSLLRLMTTSMPDVPAALRSNYADAANQIRWHKGGIGP